MRSIAFILFCCLCLFACQKSTPDTTTDPNPIPTPQNPPQTPDVIKYLSSVTISDKLSNKLQTKTEWKYDNAKRCTEVMIKKYGSNNDSTISSKIAFFYNADEKQPYRIIASPQVGNENTGSDSYIYYSADGKMIKDSSIWTHPACGSILYLTNYSYTQDAVYVEYKVRNIDFNCTMPTPRSDYDTVYLKESNVFKVVQNGSKNNNLRKDSFLYTHDEKINPFNKLNLNTSFYFIGPNLSYRYWAIWYSESDNLYIVGKNKNNILRLQNLANTVSQEFTYTYDAANYPISATTKSIIPSFASEALIKYEYMP